MPGILARLVLVVAAMIAVGAAVLQVSSSTAAEEPRAIPAPAADLPRGSETRAVAVLAGGCFWGVQGVFQHTKGVLNAVSGYAGGDAKTANYDEVSDGTTKHAEAVEVVYDPREISYGEILQIFFSVAHDPTQLNRQGPDVGPHYRSTIFPQNAEQDRVARAYVAQLDAAKAYDRKIVTTFESDKPFYPAEAYHQDYMIRNPHSMYIIFHDVPKVEALKRLFPARFRADPVLVAGNANTRS